MRTIDSETFARDWRRGELLDEPFAIHNGNPALALPVYCWSRPAETPAGAPLVLAFHGAIDRSKRVIPQFEGGPLRGALRGRAVVVGVSDPSLQLDPSLRAAWFAGHEDFDCPSLIGAVLDAMVGVWQPSRVVFAGGSTGGHATLRQSAYRPGSVAVVQNPITRITGYSRGAVEHYRSVCWPSHSPAAPLSEVALDDVSTLYGEDLENTVILLNNARDHHLFNHSSPFVNAVRGKRNRGALLYLSGDFPDYSGHSYPRAEWARWVAAAVLAPNSDRDSIATTYRGLAREQSVVSSAAMPQMTFSERDLAWNTQLLQNALEGTH